MKRIPAFLVALAITASGFTLVVFGVVWLMSSGALFHALLGHRNLALVISTNVAVWTGAIFAIAVGLRSRAKVDTDLPSSHLLPRRR
jgi:hypothetical protein